MPGNVTRAPVTGPRCPNVPKFSVKCVLVRARHSAEMLSEKQSGQARLVRDNPLQAIEAYVKYDSFGISGHLKLQCFNEDAAKNRLLYQ